MVQLFFILIGFSLFYIGHIHLQTLNFNKNKIPEYLLLIFMSLSIALAGLVI
jgi:hypothetical protein